MIVVFDTSVWISVLQFGNRSTAPTQAIEKALRQATLATCELIDLEIRRVLIDRFQWSAKDAERIVTAYFRTAIRVPVTGTVHVCRDPNDDMVLECALLAGAQAIVTGDKDLLTLGTYQDIRIMTPAEYLAVIA